MVSCGLPAVYFFQRVGQFEQTNACLLSNLELLTWSCWQKPRAGLHKEDAWGTDVTLSSNNNGQLTTKCSISLPSTFQASWHAMQLQMLQDYVFALLGWRCAVDYNLAEQCMRDAQPPHTCSIHVNDDVKGVLNSPLLCRALFSIWLGHDSVTPGATSTFVATMEKLTQQA
eukprot:1158851-Pelagomonas_calceolata.AAC.7